MVSGCDCEVNYKVVTNVQLLDRPDTVLEELSNNTMHAQ
jgi:hypothetical protein